VKHLRRVAGARLEISMRELPELAPSRSPGIWGREVLHLHMWPSDDAVYAGFDIRGGIEDEAELHMHEVSFNRIAMSNCRGHGAGASDPIAERGR